MDGRNERSMQGMGAAHAVVIDTRLRLKKSCLTIHFFRMNRNARRKIDSSIRNRIIEKKQERNEGSSNSSI